MRFSVAVAVVWVSVGVLLCGCSSHGLRDEGVSEGRVCLTLRQVRSIEALDDRHVLVRARASNLYLLTVQAGCPSLGLARRIAFADDAPRVCGDGFDFLSFLQPGVGVRRCRIVDAEVVASREEALALISQPAGE